MTENRAALKQAIHDRMLKLEEDELATAVEHYRAHLAEGQLDRREQHDKGDVADSVEALELAEAFDHPVHMHQAKLDVIATTEFHPADTVEPGAVVRFNGRWFVVCVSTTRFEVEGETYMGISVNSPAYQAMAGLKAGDTFTLNGREFEIEEVF